MKIIGSLRAIDAAQGAVRVEDVYDTGIDDLWDACTNPERLARWIAEVSGDFRPGGEFTAKFVSGWDGTGRVEVCDPPHHLLVTTWQTGVEGEQMIEASLTAEGRRTKLMVEERGISIEQLAAYGAGWQAQVEALAAYLNAAAPTHMAGRWQELISSYRELSVG